jgi:hypothetical protein
MKRGQCVCNAPLFVLGQPERNVCNEIWGHFGLWDKQSLDLRAQRATARVRNRVPLGQYIRKECL